MAAFFIAFVLAAGWAAQNVVNRSAQRSSVNVSEREQVNHLLNELSNDMWLTETALQGYLMTPDKAQHLATRGSLDRLIVDTAKLSDTAWVQESSARREKLQDLQETILELRRQSERLMEIRADAEQLFPAMRHMLEKMLPPNIEFLTMAGLAMDEARTQRDKPSQDEIRWLFSEARYAWVNMIGAFRVFVANRFGIFPGDPEAGMKEQHQRIEFYYEMLGRHLTSLTEFEKHGTLEFQQSDSLTQMRKLRVDWHRAYLTAASIYSSERWRTDIPLLRDTIRPLFTQVWAELGVLRGEIESAAVTDMTSVTHITDRLSGALWLISFITIALTAAGYLFFEYTVRRPIADVARALKAEARGESIIRMRRPTTQETRDLIEAFMAMHCAIEEGRDVFRERELLVGSFGRLFQRHGSGGDRIPPAPVDRLLLDGLPVDAHHEGVRIHPDVGQRVVQRHVGLAPAAHVSDRDQPPPDLQAVTQAGLQRRRRPWLDRIMAAASWPGFPPQSRVVPPATMAGLWLLRFRVEAAFLAIAWASGAISTVLKEAMDRPRPVAGTDLRVVAAPLGGSSFPSGHVITYVGTYGFIAYLAATLPRDAGVRVAATGSLLVLLALVGPSRIYQGHHWPTDVTASYLLGTSYLIAVVEGYRRVRASESPLADIAVYAPAAAAR